MDARSGRGWGSLVGFGLAYLVLAEAGHWLSESVHGGTIATVWLPSGLYVAGMYLARRRAGWLVLSALVAYLVDVCLIHHRDLPFSLSMFLADTAEAGVGAWCLNAVCGSRVQLTKLRDVLAFVGLACAVAPAVAATLGTPAACAGNFGSYGRLWFTWWAVDALGILLVAPMILSWPHDLGPMLRNCRTNRVLEYAGLLLGLLLLTGIALSIQPARLLVVAFPALPFLVWAALRFGALGTSVAFVVLSVSSFWYTTQGPGAQVSRLDDLLLVELLLCVVDKSFLILAGVTTERRSASDFLRKSQAMLRANYRAQSDFLSERNLTPVAERLLEDVRQVSGSIFCFLGELPAGAAGAGSVRLIAARGVGAPAIRDDSQEFDRAATAAHPEIAGLIDEVVRTGRPKVIDGLALRVGDPAGTPVEVTDLVGLPCHHLGRVVGIVGLAFRSPTYDATLTQLVPSLLLTCGHLIESDRQYKRRRRDEESLAQSERALADFFDTAPLGLHWIGPDGRVLRVNQAQAKLLGYDREELVGRHFAEFHQDPALFRVVLNRIKAGETLDNVELLLRTRDGSLRRVEMSVSGFREGHAVVHTRCLLRSVGDRPPGTPA